MDDDVAAMHPRPTLARPGWISLDGAWEFTTGTPGDDPLTLSYDHTIEVPFPPESAASGIGVDTCEEPRYRRRFSLRPVPGRRYLLHLEGVDDRARVWVDGRLAGHHRGGYVPFTLDITDALATADEHELVVAASDPASDIEIPRGKQAWTPEPAVIWYRRSSGIWRTVWLEEVAATHVRAASWTPLDALGTVRGSVTLDGWRPGLTVETTFRLGEVRLARVAVEATEPRVEFGIGLASARTVLPEELQWQPGRGRLIDVEIRVRDADGADVDAAASYFGVRTVGVTPDSVLINGRPVFQRLVLDQGYWPETHFTAPSEAALRADAELIRDLGFNGLRMHQVSADPRFLRICDELGLMVWADLPAAYHFTADALARTTDNLLALIERDRNHPSVIAWVPFNESWGLPDLEGSVAQRHAVVALHALAKALDPSRLALGNDGWEHVVGDALALHDYDHDANRLRERFAGSGLTETVTRWRPGGRVAVLAPPGGAEPGRGSRVVAGVPGSEPGGPRTRESSGVGIPVLLSEFGGVSLNADGTAWAGYGGVASPAALVAQVGALAGAVGEGSGLAGFCWTQLTDTLQEQNGLAWPDRTPKAPAAALRAAITTPPRPAED